MNVLSDHAYFRRALRIIADASADSSCRSVDSLEDAAAALLRQEERAEQAFDSAVDLAGDDLQDFVAARSSCALARRIIRHLDECVGTLSLDRYLDFATAAVMAAERVAPHGPGTRVRAWQKQGTALARKFLFPDAYRTFDVAERLAADTPIPEYYRALINYARACALNDQGRGDLASALLPSLRDTFLRHGDERAALGVAKVSARVWQEVGRYEEALACWLTLLPTVETTGSEYEIAIQRNNIGQCYIKLDDEAAARRYFDLAMPVLHRIGQIDTVARIERALARLSVARGNSNAIGDLRRAAQKFYDAGCAGEFLVTRLDVMAAILTMNPTAVVEQEAAGLAQYARACGLETYLVARLNEMTSLATTHNLTADEVNAVRDIIPAGLRMHAN